MQPQNRLGGGEGVEGLYGSIKKSGMDRVLACLAQRCGLGPDSVLVDVGAGLGRRARGCRGWLAGLAGFQLLLHLSAACPYRTHGLPLLLGPLLLLLLLLLLPPHPLPPRHSRPGAGR